ncbi:hypothetical protein Q5752_000779 [Cryptotrichosporon argae]
MLALSKRSRLAVVLITAVALVTVLRSWTAAPAAAVAAQIPPIRPGGLVVYESAVHDEVNGALARTLIKAGFDPTFICQFRFGFDTVLGHITAPHVPVVLPPNDKTSPTSLWTRLKERSVDVLVLTTCQISLPWFVPLLLETNTHVVCVVHHSGSYAYRDVKPHLAQLVKRRQVSLVVLADFLKEHLEWDQLAWAETDEEPGWIDMPIETMIPSFDYPKMIDRPEPAVFPSTVVIQGNLEPGRRKYSKIFADLVESMKRDPAVWGYDDTGDRFVPRPGDSPLQLLLIGQPNPAQPLTIPPELAHVVTIKPGLSYPDYYDLLARSDLIVPAFANNLPLIDTASSSVAAGVISRTPLLVSQRHMAAYSYLAWPAVITHSADVPEIDAIEQMRRGSGHGAYRRGSARAWEEYHAALDAHNAAIWPRLLRGASWTRQDLLGA